MNGIFLERPLSVLERRSGTVQIEFSLPNAPEQSLWARADVVYDSFDDLFHGTALRFTSMAQKHRAELRDWVAEQSNLLRSSSRTIRVPAVLESLRPPRWLS